MTEFSDPPLFLAKKRLKIKFSVEIILSKIKGTDHLIVKKKWGAQMYFSNKFESHHLFYLCFLLQSFDFQSILFKKKKYTIEC